MDMFDMRQYIVEAKFFPTSWNVKDVNGTLLGYVKYQSKGFLKASWDFNLLFEDTAGARLGEVDKTGGRTQMEYEVKDHNGQLVARIRPEKEAGHKYLSRYWMEDAQRQRLFTHGKGFIPHGHDYPIIAPDNSPVAQIHKKWVSTTTSFSVEILRQDFDPFLILSYVLVMHELAPRTPIL
jgi:uncharacterized protein YxjI